MSTLRKEYKKSKQKKEEIVSDAALNWLAENVIVINEALDRRSVKRLIKRVQKFEDTFGPFAEKVPSIKLHLDAAETALELVVTGRSKEKKTAKFLEQMSYLYSVFSDFFAKDLPVLLKSRFFRAAKAMPDQRIDMIPRTTPEGHKHNPEVIKDAFANAFKPTKDEKKLLKKMYRSTKLPEVQPQKIARELLNLTYNDLEELTKVGKVPMVTAPDPEEDFGEEEELATESVFRQTNQFLTEGILTEASIEEVGPVLQQARQIIANAGLNELEKPLDDLYSKLTQYLASDAGEKVKQTLGGAGDRALSDFFKSPGGVLLKQANMAIETLKALGEAWPKIQPLVDKQNITDQDILNIKKIITNNVSGGMFKKAAQAFGVSTKPYPGLEPESIVDALTKSTLGEGYMRWHAGVVLERRVKEQAATTTTTDTTNTTDDASLQPPTGQEAQQGVQKLASAMQALNQFATGAATTAKASGTQVSTSASETQQTQDAKSTTGTQTGSGREVAGTGAENELVQGLKKAFPKQNDQVIQQLITKVNQAGYKIVKQ